MAGLWHNEELSESDCVTQPFFLFFFVCFLSGLLSATSPSRQGPTTRSVHGHSFFGGDDSKRKESFFHRVCVCVCVRVCVCVC